MPSTNPPAPAAPPTAARSAEEVVAGAKARLLQQAIGAAIRGCQSAVAAPRFPAWWWQSGAEWPVGRPWMRSAAAMASNSAGIGLSPKSMRRVHSRWTWPHGRVATARSPPRQVCPRGCAGRCFQRQADKVGAGGFFGNHVQQRKNPLVQAFLTQHAHALVSLARRTAFSAFRRTAAPPARFAAARPVRQSACGWLVDAQFQLGRQPHRAQHAQHRVFAVALHPGCQSSPACARAHRARRGDNRQWFRRWGCKSALTVKSRRRASSWLPNTLSLRMRPSLSVTVSSPPRKVVTSMVSAPTITWTMRKRRPIMRERRNRWCTCSAWRWWPRRNLFGCWPNSRSRTAPPPQRQQSRPLRRQEIDFQRGRTDVLAAHPMLGEREHLGFGATLGSLNTRLRSLRIIAFRSTVAKQGDDYTALRALPAGIRHSCGMRGAGRVGEHGRWRCFTRTNGCFAAWREGQASWLMADIQWLVHLNDNCYYLLKLNLPPPRLPSGPVCPGRSPCCPGLPAAACRAHPARPVSPGPAVRPDQRGDWRIPVGRARALATRGRGAWTLEEYALLREPLAAALRATAGEASMASLAEFDALIEPPAA